MARRVVCLRRGVYTQVVWLLIFLEFLKGQVPDCCEYGIIDWTLWANLFLTHVSKYICFLPCPYLAAVYDQSS